MTRHRPHKIEITSDDIVKITQFNAVDGFPPNPLPGLKRDLAEQRENLAMLLLTEDSRYKRLANGSNGNGHDNGHKPMDLNPQRQEYVTMLMDHGVDASVADLQFDSDYESITSRMNYLLKNGLGPIYSLHRRDTTPPDRDTIKVAFDTLRRIRDNPTSGMDEDTKHHISVAMGALFQARDQLYPSHSKHAKDHDELDDIKPEYRSR